MDRMPWWSPLSRVVRPARTLTFKSYYEKPLYRNIRPVYVSEVRAEGVIEDEVVTTAGMHRFQFHIVLIHPFLERPIDVPGRVGSKAETDTV